MMTTTRSVVSSDVVMVAESEPADVNGRTIVSIAVTVGPPPPTTGGVMSIIRGSFTLTRTPSQTARPAR